MNDETGGSTVNAVATLPKIVRFTGMYDSGPTDGGRDCSICPHCGAKGRYTYFFETEDGYEAGAMSGCLKLFPVSPIANEQRRLLRKQLDLRVRFGPDAHLNSWDTKAMDAIEAFYAGETSEQDALRVIRNGKDAAAAYRSKKYGGRR